MLPSRDLCRSCRLVRRQADRSGDRCRCGGELPPPTAASPFRPAPQDPSRSGYQSTYWLAQIILLALPSRYSARTAVRCSGMAREGSNPGVRGLRLIRLTILCREAVIGDHALHFTYQPNERPCALQPRATLA